MKVGTVGTLCPECGAAIELQLRTVADHLQVVKVEVAGATGCLHADEYDKELQDK
jgi:hypothetical protein